jgi:hypothetical protein
MPKKLERCITAVTKKGVPEKAAWPICVKSTGIKRKKGGGWTRPHSKANESVNSHPGQTTINQESPSDIPSDKAIEYAYLNEGKFGRYAGIALAGLLPYGNIQAKSSPTPSSIEQPSASAFEINVVAKTLWGEARGEGTIGMANVAEIIKNNAKLSKTSLVKTALLPSLFSYWTSSARAKANLPPSASDLANPNERKAWQNAYKIAAMMHNTPSVSIASPEIIALKPNHYITVKLWNAIKERVDKGLPINREHRWIAAFIKSGGKTVTVGRHIFWRQL